MKIYFASDHAGFELKHILIAFVKDELGMETEDCGAYDLNNVDDYPDFVHKAAKFVSEQPESRRAIILGGSGQGEAMAANRHPGIRAAVYYGHLPRIVELSREHNDANILSLGARFLNEREAKEAVRLWLGTSFTEDDRHVRRIKKIESA